MNKHNKLGLSLLTVAMFTYQMPLVYESWVSEMKVVLHSIWWLLFSMYCLLSTLECLQCPLNSFSQHLLLDLPQRML